MLDLQDQILTVLGDCGAQSDDSLAEKLNVACSRIEEERQLLMKAGLHLDFLDDGHYRLGAHVELLSKEVIKRHLMPLLCPATVACHLKILRTIDSTNRYAREYVVKSELSGVVILSESQTAGRGRLGKVWVSPFAANIYMSIIWRFDRGAETLQGLSLVVGVGVRRSLARLGVSGVQLTWPNDVYCEGKKLGGILLEVVGDPKGQSTVIIGVGINVAMPMAAAEEIDQSWTDLMSAGATQLSRNLIVANLIASIFEVLNDFSALGFAAYRDEWESSDLFQGSQGTVSNSAGSVSGTILGVDGSGALRMRLVSGEEQRFIGGELSLRGKV
jgi:BirA family biotin operon repressor/biotin-[acetyl-CoA-carboxylase] ligase